MTKMPLYRATHENFDAKFSMREMIETGGIDANDSQLVIAPEVCEVCPRARNRNLGHDSHCFRLESPNVEHEGTAEKI